MAGGFEQLKKAVQQRLGKAPFDLAVVLGSGLGAAAENLEGRQVFPYGDYTCFPHTELAGHAGQLLAGNLLGWRVLVFQGRFHLYQGLSARKVCAPVQLAKLLGCRFLLLTNAVGGIRQDLLPGHFMAISDHINLLGDNPLRGQPNNPFLDLSQLYDQQHYAALQSFARQRGIGFTQGVLAALPGPSYETPAEIRALGLLGADAVSMSTVPEAIMGKYLGMRVAGLSYVANRAAGLSTSPLSHQEVLAVGRSGGSALAELILQLILLWQGET
ncbi:MAG: purine-nucleoside phosphorylase [Desulfuromonadaceae bacterium]|nr:purine-nucleoside phosphorylase [Desulfuromonadaceae bacterium]